MKKLPFYILILLVLQSIGMHSQNYLNETARWQQRYAWYGFQASNTCYNTYYINGDSLVNDTSYYKLFSAGHCINAHMEYDELGNGTMVEDTTYFDQLYILLREENRRFYKRQGSSLDQLLYNFDLASSGNTEEFNPYPSCGISPPSYTLLDTVCIGDIARKRWSISFSQYQLASYIIEGVGASSGMLAPVCRNGCPECSYALLNFTLNGDTLYQGTCSMPLQVDELEEEKEVRWLQTNDEILCIPPTDGVLSLWTVDGRLVMKRKVVAQEAAGIQLHKHAAGNYVVHLICNDGINESRKIFISEM